MIKKAVNLLNDYRFALTFCVFSLVFMVLFPITVKYGIFFDGLLYSAFARNLSQSIGSLWHLLSWSGAPPFRDHPPLGFWFQSFFFSLFGDRHFTEGMFGFVCLLLTGCGQACLHQSLLSNSLLGEWGRPSTLQEESKRWSPWAFLIFFLMPIVNWSFRNNMLENQLVVVTTFSSFLYLMIFRVQSWEKAMAAYVCGTLFLCVGFGIKGPPALFPLSLPCLAALWKAQQATSPHWWQRPVAAALLPTAILGLAFAVVSLFPGPRLFFRDYFYGQLVQSALGNRESSGSRLSLVWRFMENVSVPLGVLGLFSLIVRKPLAIRLRNWVFPCLIGATGCLPYLVTTKQMGWYLIPSLPFFSISIYEVFRPLLSFIDSSLSCKIKSVYTLSGILLIVAVVMGVFNYKKIYKNKEFFESFLPVLDALPSHRVYGLCHPNDQTQWQLVNAIHRYARSGVALHPPRAPVWILSPDAPVCTDLSTCTLLNGSGAPFYKIYSCPDTVSPPEEI